MLGSGRMRGLAWVVLALLLAGCSASVPPLPLLAPDATVLAFGDSLTKGKGVSRARSYPQVLAGLIRRRVINAGVSGEISAAGARRLPALLDRYQPALLLLCHGGNDFLRHLDPAATEANIRAMVAAARERGVPVLLIGVPKPGLLLRSPDFYRRIAQAYRLPYDGDTLAGILADRRLKSDAVHPNAEGYRRLAEAVRRLMQAAGALR